MKLINKHSKTFDKDFNRLSADAQHVVRVIDYFSTVESFTYKSLTSCTKILICTVKEMYKNRYESYFSDEYNCECDHECHCKELNTRIISHQKERDLYEDLNDALAAEAIIYLYEYRKHHQDRLAKDYINDACKNLTELRIEEKEKREKAERMKEYREEAAIFQLNNN